MFSSLYLFGGWLIRLIMIPVVARHHRPYVAMAWLGPIFLFPVLGSLLYFWLGYYGLKRSARQHRRIRREVEIDDAIRERQGNKIQPMYGPDQRDLVRLVEQLSTREMGGFPILASNRVELLASSEEAIQHMIDDIERAQDHAHLLFFMYVNDRTGKRVAEALARASERGVKCRLLVDAWASRKMRRSLGQWLKQRGVEVHPILPLHPLRQPLARFDVRNHRKIAVIDGRIAYTGSQNIHDADHALDEGEWHQISVRIEGPAALQLQMLFVEDWQFATDQVLRGREIFPLPEAAGDVPIQTVPDGPSYPAHNLQHVFVQALQQAQRSIVLTTPYFIPDETTLLALRLAALRGVEVDVVIPQESDRSLADTAARSYFDDVFSAGVRIYLHPSGILHAKTITVDEDFSLIGTANFDRRSLFLNYELMMLIYSEEFTGQLRKEQLRYRDAARRVEPEGWDDQSEVRRTWQETAKLLSPVL